MYVYTSVQSASQELDAICIQLNIMLFPRPLSQDSQETHCASVSLQTQECLIVYLVNDEHYNVVLSLASVVPETEGVIYNPRKVIVQFLSRCLGRDKGNVRYKSILHNIMHICCPFLIIQY